MCFFPICIWLVSKRKVQFCLFQAFCATFLHRFPDHLVYLCLGAWPVLLEVHRRSDAWGLARGPSALLEVTQWQTDWGLRPEGGVELQEAQSGWSLPALGWRLFCWSPGQRRHHRFEQLKHDLSLFEECTKQHLSLLTVKRPDSVRFQKVFQNCRSKFWVMRSNSAPRSSGSMTYFPDVRRESAAIPGGREKLILKMIREQKRKHKFQQKKLTESRLMFPIRLSIWNHAYHDGLEERTKCGWKLWEDET